MENIQDIKISTWSRWAAIGFIVALISLHILKPELNPSWNFISEYQVGRFGWLMQLAFLLLGLSCIFFVIAFWKHLNIAGKIGLVFLLISALGMFLGGIFKTDPLNTSLELQTQAGKIHQLGALLDQVPFAALLVTIALVRKKDWDVNRMLLVVMLILVWATLFYFFFSIKSQFPADGKFGPHVLVGWQNRIMITTQALWLIVTSSQLKSNLQFELSRQ